MSGQPSPSKSKKAQPAPSVSGSQRFPDLPALWVKWMPACAVISVKVMAGGALAADAESSSSSEHCQGPRLPGRKRAVALVKYAAAFMRLNVGRRLKAGARPGLA